MQNQQSNWFQNLLNNIDQLAGQFGLDDTQTNAFRDFVVITARHQYKVGSKSGAGWAFKKAREEREAPSGSIQIAKT
jgi:hypothetical protein